MITRLLRLMVGLLIALPLALVTYALAAAQAAPEAAAQAAEPTPTAGHTAGSQDCDECHGQYQTAWQSGAHSQALVDPAFQEAWSTQGQPPECLGCHTTGYDPKTDTYQAAGVTCDACHSPVASNHPLAPAHMSRSAELCGECHRDTEFEWANSRHGQSDLTCINCHDPHATSLRAEDASSLCADCHGTRVAAFGHSNHAKEGLTCTDCHITKTDAPLGMGNAQHSHTFQVDLNTCTKCHENEIHNPAAAMLVPPGGATATPETPPSGLNSGSSGTVSATPAPTSPVGFAVFAGLIGLALGMVLAPWLERGATWLGVGHGKTKVS
jgi:predicted CXXCH cytochrome family protein